MDRLARVSRSLGRLYHRALGLAMVAPTLIGARMVWGTWEAGQHLAAAALLFPTLAFAALVGWLFRPERSLSDIER